MTHNNDSRLAEALREALAKRVAKLLVARHRRRLREASVKRSKRRRTP